MRPCPPPRPRFSLIALPMPAHTSTHSPSILRAFFYPKNFTIFVGKKGCPDGLPRDYWSRGPVARSGLPVVVHPEREGNKGHSYGAQHHQGALPIQPHQGKKTCKKRRLSGREYCSARMLLGAALTKFVATFVWRCSVPREKQFPCGLRERDYNFHLVSEVFFV